MNMFTVILLLSLCALLLWPTRDRRPRIVNGAWALLAAVVSMPAVFEALVRRAKRTPHYHLPGYMDRFWLFRSKVRFLPSIRIHHIKRRDYDRHPHDHPWFSARTIIMCGWYWEKRWYGESTLETLRTEGDTALIRRGDYHIITQVPRGGVWTLFFTWGRVDEDSEDGDWGFMEGGKHVPWREYKRRHPEGPWGDYE